MFPATPSIQYWTSTPSSPSYAWIIYFRSGMPTWTFPKSTPFAVRLVHEGRSLIHWRRSKIAFFRSARLDFVRIVAK